MSKAKAHLEFDIINAGGGDAFVIRYNDKKGKRRAILIDGGDGGVVKGKVKVLDTPPKGDKANHLRPWLQKLADDGYEELELLVVTHIDSDHIGGLVDFFRGEELPLSVKNLWFNWPLTNKVEENWKAPASWKKNKDIPMGLEESIKQAMDLMTLARNHPDMAINGPYFAYLTSDRGKCRFNGVLDVTILGPSPEVFAEFKEFMIKAVKNKANAAVTYKGKKVKDKDDKLINVVSLVLLFEYNVDKQLEGKSTSLLMPGDARDDLIMDALENEEQPFKVDLLKLPHHGSKNNNSKEFFERIKPKYVVISTNGIDYGHPDSTTLTQLKAVYGANNPQKPWLYHSVPISECGDASVRKRLNAANVTAPEAGEDGQTIVLVR
ncbi:MAG TPA: hypothetical protein PLI09_04635 [Candidatus Hydrogenedentes bacterium]|nr:hypothetical protein [Candidatus Hydrogenedentota bacterium]